MLISRIEIYDLGANVVIEDVEAKKYGDVDLDKVLNQVYFLRVKGGANGASIYRLSYRAETTGQDLGIHFEGTPIYMKTKRTTVAGTYRAIIGVNRIGVRSNDGRKLGPIWRSSYTDAI